MGEPLTIGLIAATCLVALAMAAFASLKAFKAWIELKRYELSKVPGDPDLPPAAGRIEIADLRERVRKLEAIAAGIDP